VAAAGYYKCSDCGYEFLSKTEDPKCPRCKSSNAESKDIHGIVGFDE